MIDIAVFKKNEKEISNTIKNALITYFSHHKFQNCVHIPVKKINSLNFIKNYYKNRKFLLLFDDETIVSELPNVLQSSHICLVVDEFIVKKERIFLSEKNDVEKLIIKTNLENLYYFENSWDKIKNYNDFEKNGIEFLFDKTFSEDYLFVYYHIIKNMLKNKNTNKISESLSNNILLNYPNFIELAVIIGSYFYEENNLYKALEFFVKAKEFSKQRHLYDKLPMIPKYHKTVLDSLIESTKNLIKKYDQVH